MKSALHHHKLRGAQGGGQQIVVGEADDRVGGDKPQRLHAAGDGSFDDVRVGQAALGGQAVGGDAPQPRELFARGSVFVLAVPGHRRGEAAFARAHGVALAGDGKRRTAHAADLAGQHGEVVDRRDRDRTLRGMIDAHRPADKAGLRPTVKVRHALNGGRCEAGRLGHRSGVLSATKETNSSNASVWAST